MLVLSRKAEQQIQIGPNITITILKVKGLAVRIGIQAPREMSVMRGELADRLIAESLEEATAANPPSPKQPAVRRSASSRSNSSNNPRFSTFVEPSAESPRCRASRVRLATLDNHPLRSGPASAADGLDRLPPVGF